MNRSPLIVASELSQQVGEPSLRILDCRFDLMRPAAGRESWLASHIPQAAYADLDKDLAGPITSDSGRHPLPQAGMISDTFGRLGVSNSDSVVVYDSSNGAIAARAWWLLRWLGHADVRLLDGGFAAWQAGGYKTESGEHKPPRGDFAGNVQEGLVLNSAEVVAGDPVARSSLFDARDSARFRGEVEPIDPVAGHIPGTRNLPFGASLREDGHWKDGAALRELWAETAGTITEGDWAVMCGSGVTGCHLALSAQLAGLTMPRLYVGSWSEWIRDPSRPVEIGDPEAGDARNAAEPA